MIPHSHDGAPSPSLAAEVVLVGLPVVLMVVSLAW